MSECKKCGAVEPCNHDYLSEGIWWCDCKKDQKITYKVEDILDQISKEK